MTFEEILDHAIAMLQRRGRLTYRTLKRQFQLDDAALEDLKNELIEGQRLAVDEQGNVLVWMGPEASPLHSTAPPASSQDRPPLVYTPQYLAEKILHTRTALEGERKLVTVLFADIKGSTELIAGLDPEDARTLLDAALHAMMEAVHRYEGTVNQVLGDGIMALFGAPLAHEDHAIRACYTALAMQAAMRRYAEEVRRSHGLEFQIRVGLNSGDVVVRAIASDLHMDYSAVGQTTHLAARMEQLAPPGSIRLTAATLRLVEGLVHVTALGPVPVKGLAAPVDVFELVGASTLRRRLQVAATRGLTRLVGRQRELDALHQALARVEVGHGQVVALVGEAGVGKSRLVYECVHSHRTQGWLVLESTAVSYGKATPYFPVIDLLKRYCNLEDRDDPRIIRAKVTGQVQTLDEGLQETIPALLWLLDALPADSPFLTLDPPQRRRRTLDALTLLLLRESQAQPLLLVCEDLHWIDAETQALLDRLVESLSTARLLLLGTYRPEYQHGWGSTTSYTQMRLDPLPPVSAEAFVQALLGDDRRLVSLTRLLTARTEGNPFFLEETVRTLVETEVLVGTPGAYHLAQALPSIQVPATVQAVLAARLDRLPPEEKRLLQTAAVIGTDVPWRLLHALADLPDEALHRSLAHLHDAEFLDETRLFPEREYTFKHTLIQEAAYQSLLKSTRQQVHQRIAQVLEAQCPDHVVTQPERLAHHYTEAGLYAQAVGHWQRAGQRALERSAHAEAISHLRQGLAVLASVPDTPERAAHELTFQITLGPALMASKGFGVPEVEHAYTRARALCQQVGHTPQLFPALWGLWLFHGVRGALQTASALGEELLQLAQQEHKPAWLLEAHHALWMTLCQLGEFPRVHQHCVQGMALYDPQQHHALTFLYGGHDPGVCAWGYAARTLWVLGYPAQALQRSQEMLRLARQLAHPGSVAHALAWAAWLHQCRREPRLTYEWAEATLTLATEQGLPYWQAQGTILRGWALTAQGQGADGMAQMHHGLTAHRATGTAEERSYLLALLADAYRQGDYADAGLRVLAEALAHVRLTGERFYEAEVYRLEGELRRRQAVPDEPQAEACFQQALTVARRQEARSLELRAAMSLSRLWQHQGKCTAARELLAPIYGWFTEGFDTADLQDAKALLETLA